MTTDEKSVLVTEIAMVGTASRYNYRIWYEIRLTANQVASYWRESIDSADLCRAIFTQVGPLAKII